MGSLTERGQRQRSDQIWPSVVLVTDLLVTLLRGPDVLWTKHSGRRS